MKYKNIREEELKNKVIDLINESEIKDKEKIKSFLLPSVGIKIKSSYSSKAKTSKIGGYPLISSENWPLYNGVPLLFLGQINLDYINKINNFLNLKGTLFFFIYTGDVGYRYPTKKDEFKVLYFEDNFELIQKYALSTIKEYSMSFFEFYTFPYYQENIIIKNQIKEDDLELIDEIENKIKYLLNENLDIDIEHQLFGHPKAIQGSVRFWWSKQYLGFEENEELSDEDLKLINQEEDNFILLLQLNFGDAKIEIDNFGDSVLYFGIHKQDLKNRNFDNVKLVIQNT